MSITPRSAATAATAAGAILLLAAAPPVASADGGHVVVRTADRLRDLQVTTPGSFDSARAFVKIVEFPHSSRVVLRVSRVTGADGAAFGAHLHLGPCVAGDGAAALGHYNTDVLAGDPTPEISSRTEVWLDFTVSEGRATAIARVPFHVLAGARSVVIHAEETDPTTGTAGARLACLPVTITP